MSIFFEKVNDNPIIAAVNNIDGLEMAIESPCEVVALLTGNIFNLREISNKVHKNNKLLLIYIDKIDGFSRIPGVGYIVKTFPLMEL